MVGRPPKTTTKPANGKPTKNVVNQTEKTSNSINVETIEESTRISNLYCPGIKNFKTRK